MRCARENRHSALKVVKSAGRYAETARDEIKLLSQVSGANASHPGRSHIVSFLDSFNHAGPEDLHVCIVFEPLGENLLSLIERNKKKGVAAPLVKAIAKQVLLGLEYLHDECDLVHTDIKPENICEWLFHVPSVTRLIDFKIAVVAIPEVEYHINSELSTSPSPTSRRVGVPPPTKSRAGVTIPQQRRAASQRERHVQIFDSQPLSSPPSRTGSVSSSFNTGFSAPASLHSQVQKLSLSSSLLNVVAPKDTKANAKGPSVVSPSSSSSSISSAITSIPVAGGSNHSTPPTSLGSHGIGAALVSQMSVMSAKEQLKLKAEEHEEKQKKADPSKNSSTPGSPTAVKDSSPTKDESAPVQALPAGPSLLSQTAPGRSDRYSSLLSTTSPTPLLSSSPQHSSGISPASSLTPLPFNFGPPISVKIADLGNASPTTKHYTEDIQTRQYRAPEAIIGRKDWGTRADIWSVACVIFELLTAEYLFDPQGQGQLFTKDDDHMAQIIELLGDFPLEVKMGGKYSRELFDHSGALRYIRTLKPWPLRRVMSEKYLYADKDATALCQFLEPMLTVDQTNRKEAREMVNHPWLEMDENDWLGEW